jgi:hypothetical protein
VKEIKLNRGYVALVDDEDFHWLNRFNWYLKEDKDRKRYAIASVGGQTVAMHHLVLGSKPRPCLLPDHRDRNTLNNQSHNLRWANFASNAQNRRRSKLAKTGFIGVYQYPGLRFEARISVQNKTVHLGFFDTPEEAARVRDTAAIEHHKEYAVLNFPAEVQAA